MTWLSFVVLSCLFIWFNFLSRISLLVFGSEKNKKFSSRIVIFDSLLSLSSLRIEQSRTAHVSKGIQSSKEVVCLLGLDFFVFSRDVLFLPFRSKPVTYTDDPLGDLGFKDCFRVWGSSVQDSLLHPSFRVLPSQGTSLTNGVGLLLPFVWCLKAKLQRRIVQRRQDSSQESSSRTKRSNFESSLVMKKFSFSFLRRDEELLQ